SDLGLDQQQTCWIDLLHRQVDKQSLQLCLGYWLEQPARIVIRPVCRLRYGGNEIHRHALMTAIGTQHAVDLPATHVGQQDVEEDRRKTVALQRHQSLLSSSTADTGEAVLQPNVADLGS